MSLGLAQHKDVSLWVNGNMLRHAEYWTAQLPQYVTFRVEFTHLILLQFCRDWRWMFQSVTRRHDMVPCSWADEHAAVHRRHLHSDASAHSYMTSPAGAMTSPTVCVVWKCLTLDADCVHQRCMSSPSDDTRQIHRPSQSVMYSLDVSW